jgi:hypothetical protein
MGDPPPPRTRPRLEPRAPRRPRDRPPPRDRHHPLPRQRPRPRHGRGPARRRRVDRPLARDQGPAAHPPLLRRELRVLGPVTTSASTSTRAAASPACACGPSPSCPPAPTPLARLNAMPEDEATAALLACNGSPRWARTMAALRPFEDAAAALRLADRTWWSLPESDHLEAFAAHPRIGERKAAVDTGTTAATWSAGEQSGMNTPTPPARAPRRRQPRLRRPLRLLLHRLRDRQDRRRDARPARAAPHRHPRVRAAHRRRGAGRDHPPAHHKTFGGPLMGISTHILDTATGRPAPGVTIRLERQHADAGTPSATARPTTTAACAPSSRPAPPSTAPTASPSTRAPTSAPRLLPRGADLLRRPATTATTTSRCCSRRSATRQQRRGPGLTRRRPLVPPSSRHRLGASNRDNHARWGGEHVPWEGPRRRDPLSAAVRRLPLPAQAPHAPRS